MKTKTQRIFYYDFLRAFAIIAVIICHVDIFYGSLETPIQILSKIAFHDIGRMGVPIFLMISGALLLNREYNLGEFLKKRFTRIIYPFIFWMSLIIIGMILFKSSYDYIWNVFIGNPSVTWYFWTLIGIYLAIPILNSFIKEYGEKGLKYILIIWLLVMALNSFNSYPLFPYFTLDYFAGYIGYPILGYYLSNKKFELSNSKIIIAGAILFLLSFSIYVYVHYSNIELLSSIYQNIPIVIMASSFYVIIKTINDMNSFNRIKDNMLGRCITSLSTHSYGMYFSHVIVLKALSMINPKSNLLFPVILLAMIILSWLLVEIASRFPHLKIFSGI